MDNGGGALIVFDIPRGLFHFRKEFLKLSLLLIRAFDHGAGLLEFDFNLAIIVGRHTEPPGTAQRIPFWLI